VNIPNSPRPKQLCPFFNFYFIFLFVPDLILLLYGKLYLIAVSCNSLKNIFLERARVFLHHSMQINHSKQLKCTEKKQGKTEKKRRRRNLLLSAKDVYVYGMIQPFLGVQVFSKPFYRKIRSITAVFFGGGGMDTTPMPHYQENHKSMRPFNNGTKLLDGALKTFNFDCTVFTLHSAML